MKRIRTWIDENYLDAYIPTLTEPPNSE